MSDVIIKNIEGSDIIQYQPVGVCSKMMQIKIVDNKITDVEILGGCSGNLNGISNLVKGMNINDVISRLSGISCGSKQTSCPDQLAYALNSYVLSKHTANV